MGYTRPMLLFRTAGESHGQSLIALIEGIPAHLLIDFDFIDNELKRRQGGYGRGGRMKIEKDRVVHETLVCIDNCPFVVCPSFVRAGVGSRM